MINLNFTIKNDGIINDCKTIRLRKTMSGKENLSPDTMTMHFL